MSIRRFSFFFAWVVVTARFPLMAALGDVDSVFRLASSDGSQGTGEIRSLVLQPDGKALVIGRFVSINNVTRVNIGRVLANGSNDSTFPPVDAGVEISNAIFSSAVLPDGKIVVGAGVRFRTPADHTASYARIHADGTEDETFSTSNLGSSLMNRSFPDGKLLIMQIPDILMRLTQTGERDSSFNPRITGDSTDITDVLSSVIQEDGNIIIGGRFNSVGGVRRNALARLLPDGRLDLTFRPDFASSSRILALALQADGSILAFESYWITIGFSRGFRVVRLFPDGTKDETFDVRTGTNVYSLAVQADGRILIGGNLLTTPERDQKGIIRVNPDGSLDESFDPKVTEGNTIGLTIQPDGGILAAGHYRLSGQPTVRQALRFLNDPATQSLQPAGAGRVEWRRGGSSPETHWVWFELSLDGGATWTELGRATRMPGGWELSGLSLPPAGTLRARAITYGGMYNGSQNILETVAAFTAAPEITVHAGESADAPELTSGQAAAVDFGEARLNVPATRAFTLANTGTAPLRIGGLAVPDGFSWVEPPAVPFDIAPGASTLLTARLDAAALGAFSGTIGIESDDADEAVFTFPVTGVVTAPDIALFDGTAPGAGEIESGREPPLDFGEVRRGAALSRGFLIANQGSAPLAISQVSVPAGYQASIAPPSTISPGGSLSLVLTRDTSVLGVLAGGVAIASDDPDEPSFRFPIVSTVVDPEIGVLYVTEPAPVDLTDGQTTLVDFGEARQTHPIILDFSIVNEGTAPLLVGGLAVPAGYSVLEEPAWPRTVDAGASLPLRVQLDASALGAFSGTVEIASDDFDEPVFRFPVTGLVTAPEIAVRDGTTEVAPELTAGQSAAVDFGEARLPVPISRTFTLANTGTAPLRIGRLAVPDGFSWVEPPAVPFDMAPDTSALLTARMDAAALGTFAGEIVIESDDLDEAVFAFPVIGLVTAPEIAVHDGATTAAPELTAGQAAAVDFGRNIQGTPGARTITIANTGTAPLAVASITAPPGYELADSPALPAAIAPRTSAAWEVRLVSLAAEVHTGSVIIASDDLDESVFAFPVTGEVFIPAPAATLPGPQDAANTTLNRQTGLREQTIHLANDTTATVPGYRLLMRGLPAGVTLANASEVRADGAVVVLVRQPLAPFSSFDLVLEYVSADRRPVSISPEVTVEVVLELPDDPAADAAETFAIDRVLWLPDENGLLLEFGSQPGRLYAIQYSDDGTVWKTSPTQVRAAGNRTQWIDRGPPRTPLPPASQNVRIYRVLLLTE